MAKYENKVIFFGEKNNFREKNCKILDNLGVTRRNEFFFFAAKILCVLFGTIRIGY